MTRRDPPPDSLTRDLDPNDREELLKTAERVERERPVPRHSFRVELRRALRTALIEPELDAPRRVSVLVAAYAGSGLILLALAAVGVGGAGPLAAG